MRNGNVNIGIKENCHFVAIVTKKRNGNCKTTTGGESNARKTRDLISEDGLMYVCVYVG